MSMAASGQLCRTLIPSGKYRIAGVPELLMSVGADRVFSLGRSALVFLRRLALIPALPPGLDLLHLGLRL